MLSMNRHSLIGQVISNEAQWLMSAPANDPSNDLSRELKWSVKKSETSRVIHTVPLMLHFRYIS
jgi:hypothetical protein